MRKHTLDPDSLRVESFEPAPALAAASIATQAGEATCTTCGNPPRMDDDAGAFRTLYKCCV